MSDSMIAESAARLFADNVDKPVREGAEKGEFPGALWKLATDSGFAVATATESSGGIGETWDAAYPILRGLGYWQVPLPLAETMIGAQLLSMAGIEVPEGPLAIVEQGQDNNLADSGSGSARVLSGSAHRVAWARHAGFAVVSLASGDIALIDLRDSAKVQIAPGLNHARLPADGLTLDGARISALARNPLAAMDQPVWTLGAMARSVMMVGALEWLLEQSVQYANDRVQFGKPIGRYQAIQQQLALLAGDVAASRVAAIVAATDAPSSSRPASAQAVFSAAVAKARVGESATRGTSIAHQVHGAIGFTHEHQLHFATRRLWAWREEFGSDAWWAERLGQAAIQSAAAGFWPALTARQFPGKSLAG